MSYKWIGAILIFSSCGGFGLSLVFRRVQEEAMIHQLEAFLDEMLWELPFQLTPLPDLVRHASAGVKGQLKALLYSFSIQLDRQVLPDAAACMDAAIHDSDLCFLHVRKLLTVIGHSLGRFDLSSQLNGLSSAKEQCSSEYAHLHSDRADRLRSFQTLSFCAGAALVILLI